MTNYEKLINTLTEVFMLDKAELDFGIYRIMNQKRKDIEQFLQKDLVPQVKKVLSESLSIDKQALQKELDDAIKSALALGADPESLPKVQQIKARLGEAADMVGIENEVFSLLANFFKRYYDNGDFVSMRRYKKDVYAIPYEGEEVKLHWANADQYYIKTSENFKNYRFKLSNGKSVSFELIEASTEQNNNKIQGNKERRFALYDEKHCEFINHELKIYFTYELMEKGISQAELIDIAFDKLLKAIPNDYKLDLLSQYKGKTRKKKIIKTGSNGKEKKSDIEVPLEILFFHLRDYTARNTFDYFIHKDLGGFLIRELDFYIKNEVLFIDDLNTRDEQEFLKQLSKIKAIKKIGEKIIAFLAQLENFQKKLWLKKKIVVDCNFCITLDLVPEEMHSEIIDNKAQLQEWINLFAIDHVKSEKSNELFPSNKVGFSNPLTREFLVQNKHLVIDTAHFSDFFKWKLISSIENFDEKCKGWLFSSENFNALNLINTRFNQLIDCTYIDPPFNLGGNGDFLYKTDYCDSSWTQMLFDRIILGKSILRNDSKHFLRCDNNGNYLARQVLDAIFNPENFQAELLVQRIRKNVTEQGKISMPLANDSLFLFYNSPQSELINPFLKLAEKRDSYWRRIDDSSGYRNPPERLIFGYTFYPFKHDAHFKFSQSTIESMILEGKIRILCRSCKYEHLNGKWIGICPKCNDEDFVPQYQVQETDVKVLDTNWLDISGYASTTGFSTENSEILLERVLEVGSNPGGFCLDYFLGSGTTAAVALKKNRKIVGIEVGGHFYSIIIPRIKKVLAGSSKGIKASRLPSSIIKYHSLESYEDTLNNLALRLTESQQHVLNLNPSFKEGYMLNYMLDVETQDSLLNLEWFIDPFNCYLDITLNNEMKPTKVDLVETFNYLIGLIIESYAVPKEGYKVVTGKNLAGESILVVWRDCTMHNSIALNTFLEKSKYNPLDSEYDRIYVNGDNNVENLKLGDERWKVVLIEEEFKKRMFENT